MTSKLTPEQLESRMNTNKKILKFGCLPIFIICFIVFLIPSSSDDKVENKKVNIDSLLVDIRKDSLYDVTDVYYNKKDSSLNVAIKYDKNDLVSASGFYKNHKLDSLPIIEGLYIYKKGTKLIDAEKSKSIDYVSINVGKRIEKFEKSGYEYQIQSYLEKNVNDPTDLEIINKWVLGENSDGTFSVKVTFRAKNPFGALMMHTLNCDMDMEGNARNIEFDK